MDFGGKRNEKIESGRTLLFFPIIHSPSEMGTLAPSIQKGTLEKVEFQPWKEKAEFINRFWLDVENTVFNELSLQFERTRVYQDGLPICDKEEAIVADIAKMESPNFKILLRLKEMGAIVMGTESASLLIEEYQQAKLMLKISRESSSQETATIMDKLKEVSSQLLEKRDTFIAARIDQTLQSGETGILFLGMLHNPIAFLPADIRVRYPIGSPLEN